MLKRLRQFFAAGASPPQLSAPRTNGAWVRVFDWRPGAWQADAEFNPGAKPDPLLHSATYACIRAIASDIAKLWPRLLQRQPSGIWTEYSNTAHSPLLRKPNRFQVWAEFITQWLVSKLTTGNTYVLLWRDARGVVVRMNVLDPNKVSTYIGADGSVWYGVLHDYLLGPLKDEILYIPATEMLHDKYMPLVHPLIGSTPLAVAALSAVTARRQVNSNEKLYAGGLIPPGVIEVPEEMTQAQVDDASARWTEFRASGKTAILDGGLKYTPLQPKSVDMQAIELLKWNAQDVCIAFGVPAWRAGVEPMPSLGSNPEVAELTYHSQTLQHLIEMIEQLLDFGLTLPDSIALELDVSALKRMDSTARFTIYKTAVSAGVMTPNEARKMENLAPVEGGDVCYLQQQNYSLAALAKRDAQPDPFLKSSPQAPAAASDAATSATQEPAQ